MLWCRNLERLETPVYSVKAHKEIINAIDGAGGLGIGEGAPEIVTGGRDGELLLLLFTRQTWVSRFHSASYPQRDWK